MKVAHISDTHGYHESIKVSPCDLLIATGDYGKGRTSLKDLLDFTSWLENQPADQIVFIAGNHDQIVHPQIPPGYNPDIVARMLHRQQYEAALENISAISDGGRIKYLKDESFVYKGFKIHGMPWSPEFHSDYWVFNATEEDMVKHLAKVPSDVNILLSHGPAYGYQDLIPQDYQRPGEDLHRGCKKTMEVIHKRLKKLKLFAFGHIHNSCHPNTTGADNYGVRIVKFTNTRSALFSNGACVDNDYNIVCSKPLIMNL